LKLINKTNNTIISENVMIADTFFKRLKGLMFTKELPEQSALHIKPCNEIHTFNMKYSIDVLYLDVNNNILAVDEDMRPCKIGKHVKKATSVVELPSGKIKKLSIQVGETVEFSKIID
jgi:uncharacterized membrane protein (UPF0127 family)